MCDCQLTRREALIGSAITTAALVLAGSSSTSAAPSPPAVPAVEVMPGLSIYPRDAWGADLPPKRALIQETPQFLLVHHTAGTDQDPRGQIRATYAWHTSAAKGWPDVCYEFFVDRDGGVWEGRQGAMWHPVVADATGGSQGFAQLVCLIGEFTSVAPTAAAQASLVKVLAWLADRWDIDVSAGATTTFTSRGSQKWKAGTVVTTPTIAGHRDMSYTACPGDQLYALIPDLRTRVIAQLDAWSGAMRPARRLGPVQP